MSNHNIGATQAKLLNLMMATMPTIADMAAYTGNTKGATWNQLTRLINRGFVKRNNKRDRKYVVTSKGKEKLLNYLEHGK